MPKPAKSKVPAQAEPPKPAVRTAPRSNRFHAAEMALRKHALSLPEAVEEFPWGHRAFKVRKKAFLFLAWDAGVFSLSVKLPESATVALMLPFAEPTGYGLGRSGWVTSRFTGKDDVPVPMLCQWIAESYRAIAPKKLAALVTR